MKPPIQIYDGCFKKENYLSPVINSLCQIEEIFTFINHSTHKAASYNKVLVYVKLHFPLLVVPFI